RGRQGPVARGRRHQRAERDQGDVVRDPAHHVAPPARPGLRRQPHLVVPLATGGRARQELTLFGLLPPLTPERNGGTVVRGRRPESAPGLDSAAAPGFLNLL